MSASKILTTAVATATIVGAIGFASAQTASDSNTNSAQGTTSTEPMQNPSAAPSMGATTPSTDATTMPSSSSSTDNSTAPSTSTDPNAAPASEPAPKADRN